MELDKILMHRGSNNFSPKLILGLNQSVKSQIRRGAISFKSIDIPKIDLNKAILERNDSSKL